MKIFVPHNTTTLTLQNHHEQNELQPLTHKHLLHLTLLTNKLTNKTKNNQKLFTKY